MPPIRDCRALSSGNGNRKDGGPHPVLEILWAKKLHCHDKIEKEEAQRRKRETHENDGGNECPFSGTDGGARGVCMGRQL